ncbi:hypothetical protein [Streptomyces sp. NPDC049906]|uniref:hypothetical protein n=1 Tax=Streptomyces sp. NPDC049906 TaxID=3155656 RepID=UPI00343C7FEF
MNLLLTATSTNIQEQQPQVAGKRLHGLPSQDSLPPQLAEWCSRQHPSKQSNGPVRMIAPAAAS